jgi:hypothetical protein
MRDLNLNELSFVTGAGSSPTRPSGYGCSPAAPKGNNGFGNGGNDGSNAGKQDVTR